MTPLAYVPYHRLDGRPNVVVDGSPTAGTTLTLTHWPGYPAPAGLERDLSAQIAFAYLDAGAGRHAPAGAVSNNHVDQDGLVSLFALTRPDAARDRRERLIDLAAAGDFATYRDRTAARLSMAVAGYADAGRSPLRLEPEGPERDAQLYTELLGRLPEWCDNPGRIEALWVDEDATLRTSEELLAGGTVTITERPDVDLAVLDVPEGVALAGGHRFAHLWYEGLHPMAVNNATDRFAVLTRHGWHYRLAYRYETWVAYRSVCPRTRRPLAPLAEELTALEPAGVTWTAAPSSALEPVLEPAAGAESGIGPDAVVDAVVRHLAGAAPDWDPYRVA